MSSIQLPINKLQITNASPDIVTNSAQRILIIGQAEGTNNFVKNVDNDLFSQKSMLGTMIREYKKIDKVNVVDAYRLDDPVGIKSEAFVEFLISSTHDSGEYEVVIQSRQLHSFTLQVNKNDTVFDLRDNLIELINNDDSILVVASAVGQVVRLECVHAGRIGNDICTAIFGSVSGINAFISPFSLGEGIPSIIPILNIIQNIRYQTIVFPSEYDKLAISSYLDNRFNDQQILDGVAIITQTGSSNLLTDIAFEVNSFSTVLLGNKRIDKLNYHGGAILELSAVISSTFSAVRSLRLTIGQNVSKYLVGAITQGSNGGPGIAAVPYANTIFGNLPLVADNLNWDENDQVSLNDKGVSFLGNNLQKTSIISGNIVTTFQNASENNIYKYLNYIDTMSNIREFFVVNLEFKYSQSKLTQTTAIDATANPSAISSAMIDLYYQLANEARDGVVYRLVDPTKSGIDFFKNNLNVNIDIGTGTVFYSSFIKIVSQIRDINTVFVINYYA